MAPNHEPYHHLLLLHLHPHNQNPNKMILDFKKAELKETNLIRVASLVITMITFQTIK